MHLSVTIQVWTCESMDTRVKIRVYFWIPFLSCGSQGSYLECRVWQPGSSPSEPFWFFSALDPKQPTAISEGQQKVVALVLFPCWFVASFFRILRAHLQQLPRLAPGYLKISLPFVPHQPPTPKCSSSNPSRWGSNGVLCRPGP